MRYVWPKFMPDHCQLYSYRHLVRMPPIQKTSQLLALITQLSRPLGIFCFAQFNSIWKEVFKAPLTIVQQILFHKSLKLTSCLSWRHSDKMCMFIANGQAWTLAIHILYNIKSCGNLLYAKRPGWSQFSGEMNIFPENSSK